MAGHEYLRVHRVIAAIKIGRPLLKGEVVHHIDGDKHNNDPANLEVMTQSEHAKLHHTGAKRGLKALCKFGHALTGENVKINKRGVRRCRLCERRYGRAWKRAERVFRGLKKPGPKRGTPGLQRIIE